MGSKRAELSIIFCVCVCVCQVANEGGGVLAIFVKDFVSRDIPSIVYSEPGQTSAPLLYRIQNPNKQTTSLSGCSASVDVVFQDIINLTRNPGVALPLPIYIYILTKPQLHIQITHTGYDITCDVGGIWPNNYSTHSPSTCPCAERFENIA